MQHPQDSTGLVPRFHLRPVQDHPATREAGTPIFRDKEWIDIFIPGDNQTVISRAVTDEDRERFWRHYEAFQRHAAKTEQVIGTPLEAWGILTPSQIATLRAAHVPTVQALAQVSDSNLGFMMGMRGLRDKARAYVKAAEEAAPLLQLNQENESLRERIATLEAQLEDLANRLGGDEPPRPKRKKGAA